MTINGNNFSAGATVNFNGVNIAVGFVSSTQVFVTVPAGSGTNVPIYVTVGGQASNTNNSFSYLSPTATTTPTATPQVVPPIPYPNPVTGPGPVMVQLVLQNSNDPVKLKIFTTAFRKILEKNLTAAGAGVQTFTVDLDDNLGAPLANGLYYLVVQTPQGRFIEKLLILR